MGSRQERILRGALGVKPPFLRNFFQFARGFPEKNPKIPPKLSRPYKEISKTLPRKISGYAPGSRLSVLLPVLMLII